MPADEEKLSAPRPKPKDIQTRWGGRAEMLANGFVGQFFGRNDPGANRGREVFRFSRTKPDGQFQTFNIPSGPIVQDRIAPNMAVSVIKGNTAPMVSDDTANFERIIEFFGIGRIRNFRFMRLKSVRVAIIKDRRFRPFDRQIDISFFPFSFGMGFEGIIITKSAGLNRRQVGYIRQSKFKI